ncbi:restriction endonuclease subunit S [Streptomyces sp. NPDC001351]|uniref:restriction endonuclease subunit S n=1 Tax=Streptomyces sp. NPDC001351 TaxID=3364564 RepID=UPI0036B5BADB
MRGDDALPARLMEATRPLEEVADSIGAGITLGPNRAPRENPAGYLRVANVQRGWIDSSDVAQLEAYSRDRDRYALAVQDILMVEGHASPDQIGRCAMVSSREGGLLYQNHLFRIRFSKVAPEFGLIWLNSRYMQSYWRNRCATSSGLYTINSAMLRQVPVPLLPEAEQHRIVAAHAAFERRIVRLEWMLSKLGVAEQALSAEALALKPHWERVTVESIAEVAAGVTLGAELVGEGTLELPYLRVANVLDGRIDTQDVKSVRILGTQLERFALRKGDLLLTEGGDLDKLGRGAVWDGRIEPCLHQNHVFRVRCGSRMDPGFLALYTGSAEGRAYFQRVGKQTTNLASINSTQVKAMVVPVPPIEEQRRNLEPIRAVRSRCRALERQISKLRTIQQAVVEDLLAGRVRASAA